MNHHSIEMESDEAELSDVYQQLCERKEELRTSVSDHLSDFEKQLLENVATVMEDLKNYVQDILQEDFNLSAIRDRLESIEVLQCKIKRMEEMLLGFSEMSKGTLRKGLNAQTAILNEVVDSADGLAQKI